MKRCDYCGSVCDDKSYLCPVCGTPFRGALPGTGPVSENPLKAFLERNRTWLAALLIVLLAAVLFGSLPARKDRAQEPEEHYAYGTDRLPAAEKDDAEIRKLQQRAAEYEKQDDAEGILRLAEGNGELFRKDAELSAKQEEAALAFQEQIAAESVSRYKAAGYAAALEVVRKGLSLLPGDRTLLRYEELYSSCIPTDLNALTILDRKGFMYTGSSVTDPYGIEHAGAYADYCMDYFTKNITVDYVLNYKYSVFRAAYFVNKYKAQLRIYADGVCVFDSGIFDKTKGAVAFSVPVRNVRVLRVETISHSEISVVGDLDTSRVYLVDMSLERELSDEELRP